MTSEAPERIWATPEDGYCTATDLPSDKRDALGFVQYIRADLSPQWRPISEAPRGQRLLLVTTVNGKPAVDIGGFDDAWTSQCWVWSNPKIKVGTEPYAWMHIPPAPGGPQ